MDSMGSKTLPSRDDLARIFFAKYGPIENQGWAPRQRFRFGYFMPADVYECVVANCLEAGSRWLDVGGGHNIFPENPELARQLAAKAGRVVAVDPSENVLHNAFVHESAQSLLEDFRANEPFRLATMRMVVEHVSQPERFVETLSRLVAPGGTAIVFTVNRRSPISLISRLIPFRFHHRVKKIFWGGEEEDTFPVCYLMNTREELRAIFEKSGFREEWFARLDDLSTFGLFKRLNYLELQAWRIFKSLGLAYPENCLLGVYRRRA